MNALDWEKIKTLADQKAVLLTKSKIPFRVEEVTDATITVRVRSGENHTISRKNLEKAVKLIQAGEVFNGPKAYRDRVADDRPAYAWAILRELGYLQQ